MHVHIPIQEGFTSLILASKNGHVEVVEALLNFKADPNITDKVRVHAGLLLTSRSSPGCFFQLLNVRGGIFSRSIKKNGLGTRLGCSLTQLIMLMYLTECRVECLVFCLQGGQLEDGETPDC